MRGKLVVIDGTDGSGKHTQTVRLMERLEAEGVPARTLAFPQYEGSFFGQVVARYLRGEFGDSSAVDPHLAAMLFAMDRWEAKGRLERWLAEGYLVVLDRYVSANAGHQSIKIADPLERERFLAWVEEMEFNVLGLPRPDRVLFLHMPWRVAQDLVGRKPGRPYLRGETHDIHEADADHLRLSEEAFVRMAERHAEWRRIECFQDGRVLSPERIADRVWEHLSALLADE